jgi:MoaA/NifB/PqqE/SkfB family radical SAM enzyme
MASPISTLADSFSINHVWLFLTERCNLSCDYCFFRDHGGKTTISIAQVRALFDALPSGRIYDVVLSGGEPLLEWDRVREVIALVRRQLPGSRITVQTNGLLLDKSRIAFLKARNVRLEFGIDGKFTSDARHRAGTRSAGYERLLANIRLAVVSGIRIGATMTVHPNEVSAMRDNFLWLVEIGLRNIEVHPAFLASWTPSRTRLFDTGYRKIAACDMAFGGGLLGKNYSKTVSPLADIVLQPDGKVLPNWTYLIFPLVDREPFYMMDVKSDGVTARPLVMAAFVKAARKFFAKPRTYRDYSNFNARRVLAEKRSSHLGKIVRAYEQACHRAQAVDRRCLQVGYGIPSA